MACHLHQRGQPHCVTRGGGCGQPEAGSIGPAFEHHANFPERINTEFVQVVDAAHLKMRVWERGSGETWACGTGTCATVAALTELGICPAGEDIHVQLRGGVLTIRVLPGKQLLMTGAAVYEGTVCEGERPKFKSPLFCPPLPKGEAIFPSRGKSFSSFGKRLPPPAGEAGIEREDSEMTEEGHTKTEARESNMKMNKHYNELKASYLFVDIAHKVAAYQEAHPEKKIIRLGIGDVTQPLAKCVVTGHARCSR